MRSVVGPAIAVVVPNRNDSRYLPVSLNSVLDQAVGPDEVVVVDDQSTDDSVEVIRSLIAGHPHARLVVNPVNLGVYGAIDEGLKHIRSEYVLFLAANDWLLPGIFERAKACLAQAPGVGLWSAMAWMVDEHDRPLRLHPSPVVSLRETLISPRRCIELAHLLGNWFTGPSLIYQRRALDEAERFDAAYMGLSDWFTALIVASRHGAAYSPAPLCAIRKHAGSYSARTFEDPARLDDILRRVSAYGSRVAPQLFTPRFIARTVQRLHFASIRSSGGATMEGIAERSPAFPRRVLRFFNHLLPRSWRSARVAAAFVVLRPFDLAPTLWYRLLGWLFVRYRSRRIAPPRG